MNQYMDQPINPSPLSASYTCRWTRSALGQVMDYSVFGAMLDPMLTHWEFSEIGLEIQNIFVFLKMSFETVVCRIAPILSKGGDGVGGEVVVGWVNYLLSCHHNKVEVRSHTHTGSYLSFKREQMITEAYIPSLNRFPFSKLLYQYRIKTLTISVRHDCGLLIANSAPLTNIQLQLTRGNALKQYE